MVFTEEKLNLVQKLAKIRAISDVVTKNKKGYGYTYADITEILAKITAGMKKYEVSLFPIIVPQTMSVTQSVAVNTKFDKTGKPFEQTSTEMLVRADMVFKWVNDEDPTEFVDIPWVVTGAQSDPSQALGSGLTYCTRYFLTSFFQIAQPDSDVDAYRSKQKAAEEQEDRTIAEAIISDFDTTVRKYLADHQENADNVKKFISKFVKKGDYFAIKEPSLAAKLSDDFKKEFLKESE